MQGDVSLLGDRVGAASLSRAKRGVEVLLLSIKEEPSPWERESRDPAALLKIHSWSAVSGKMNVQPARHIGFFIPRVQFLTNINTVCSCSYPLKGALRSRSILRDRFVCLRGRFWRESEQMKRLLVVTGNETQFDWPEANLLDTGWFMAKVHAFASAIMRASNIQ